MDNKGRLKSLPVRRSNRLEVVEVVLGFVPDTVGAFNYGKAYFQSVRFDGKPDEVGKFGSFPFPVSVRSDSSARTAVNQCFHLSSPPSQKEL